MALDESKESDEVFDREGLEFVIEKKLLEGGGQVLFIRHATTTPGVGDPEGFSLADCRTQRNLSDAGRDEARRLGEALRAREEAEHYGDVLTFQHGAVSFPAFLPFELSPETIAANVEAEIDKRNIRPHGDTAPVAADPLSSTA